MRKGKPSRTAEAAAFQRAAHLKWDDAPALFRDDKVAALLSPAARTWLNVPAGIGSPRSGLAADTAIRQMRGQIVLRARYTEDVLEKSLLHGLSQYVILSAGLDTFALRRRDVANTLEIFEVDQPDTQRWKRHRLGAAKPANLTFISIDFERQSIADALRKGGFDSHQPAFFSWLGTTYYLSRDAIFSTLASILSVAASGSELVFDFWSSAPGLDWQARLLLGGIRVAVALQSEPMLSFFAPAQIEHEAMRLGFEISKNVSPADLRAAYLGGRADRLDVPDFAHMLHLRVP